MKIIKTVFNIIVITISIFLIIFNGIVIYNKVVLRKELLSFCGYSMLIVVSR